MHSFRIVVKNIVRQGHATFARLHEHSVHKWLEKKRQRIFDFPIGDCEWARNQDLSAIFVLGHVVPSLGGISVPQRRGAALVKPSKDARTTEGW